MKREEERRHRVQEMQKDQKERQRADKERAALQTQLEEANALIDDMRKDLKSERQTVR